MYSKVGKMGTEVFCIIPLESCTDSLHQDEITNKTKTFRGLSRDKHCGDMPPMFDYAEESQSGAVIS